jgi:predicted patatin/cPLA2 family phospholipase
MLDGGIADSIPLLRAREMGYNKNIVVLTRNKGYRKPDRDGRVLPFFYSKYPAVKEAIRRRNSLYNSQVSLVEELEAKGEIIVLRPEKPIAVDRMEKDGRKLRELYDEGYAAAAAIDFR